MGITFQFKGCFPSCVDIQVQLGLKRIESTRPFHFVFVEGIGASSKGFYPSTIFVFYQKIMAEADLRDVLPHIDVPTLLLYGDKDVRAPLAVAEDLHAAIPNSRVVVLPGVGHMSSVESPGAFNAEVRSFLQDRQD